MFKNKQLIRIIIFAIFVIAIAILIRVYNITSIDELIFIINNNKQIAPIVYMVLFAILPTFFVPVTVLAICAGAVFGLVYASIYTFIAAFINTTITYFISKYLAYDYVKQIIQEKHQDLYDIYDENLIFDESTLLSDENENKEDFVDLNSFYQSDEIKKEDNSISIDDNMLKPSSSVVIDDETKKLLNSFDEEVVHAHIKINPLKKIFTPFVSLIVPIALYLGLSEYEFKKVIPMILLMECILLISTIINAIKRLRRKGLT